MGDFNEDLLNAVDKRHGDVADVVGMPDDKDYTRLLKIINKFRDERFFDPETEESVTGEQLIKHSLEQGRRDYETGTYRKYKMYAGKNLVNKDSNTVYVAELPEELFMRIEKTFPTMFKSKKHLSWFKKNFSKLMLENE